MNDPYLNRSTAEDRLAAEWIKYGKIIIALDYDDTIFDFHNKGYTYDAVVDLVRKCSDAGAYICVFTGSPPEKYDSIRAHMTSLNIPLASINENPFPMPFGNHGKMYYNVLLDDRAGLDSAYHILDAALSKFQLTQHT